MYWPVKVPYTTRPSMTKLVGDLYNKNPDLYYLQEKHKEISLLGDDLWAVLPVASNLIKKSCEKLGLPITTDIVNFGMRFEEDVAILHDGKLVAICFCFPSSWIPRERIGMDLERIHGPVADGEYLRNASKKLAVTMADPVLGCFQRSVWTIKSSGQLSNHPSYQLPEPTTIEDLWIRVENQTTLPLGDGMTSLFFVKVITKPLTDFWSDPDKREDIVESVNSMSESILEYKNLRGVKQILNQSL